MMDLSKGYESISAEWLATRGNRRTRSNAIGVKELRRWVKSLPHGSSVLDLGCGSGFPVAAVLIEEGLQVFGVDAAPSLVAAFLQNLPGTPVICESVLESSFFDRKFDAVLAIGLMFLLQPAEQRRLIPRIAEALAPGGHLLFTSPAEPHIWTDIMTGWESISLGADQYCGLLAAVGLVMVDEFADDGQNHYYLARKTGQNT